MMAAALALWCSKAWALEVRTEVSTRAAPFGTSIRFDAVFDAPCEECRVSWPGAHVTPGPGGLEFVGQGNTWLEVSYGDIGEECRAGYMIRTAPWVQWNGGEAFAGPIETVYWACEEWVPCLLDERLCDSGDSGSFLADEGCGGEPESGGRGTGAAALFGFLGVAALARRRDTE
jgi:MYXO-CTERM domain-containing protein